MTRKQINQIEDKNLKAIMLLIKKLETNNKKLHKLFKKNDETNSIR